MTLASQQSMICCDCYCALAALLITIAGQVKEAVGISMSLLSLLPHSRISNTTCSLIFLLFITFSCMLPFGDLMAGCITNN